MKHFYVLILLYAFASNAQTITITDPNFERALIAIGLDQGTVDGTIEATNVIYVRELNIPNKNISDLSGLSAFINLEKINASGNSISAIDFSKNLYLKEIILHSNELTSINVSNNVWLESLNVYKNKLSAISLTNNRNLNYLAIADNNITALDVTANEKIVTIYAQNNQIADIDVTELKNLETLNFQDNSVATLNTTNATALKQLNGSSNFLSTLDVSTNTALDHINVMFNAIETLDCSTNTALTTVIASHNELTSLNVRNGSNETLAVLSIENNPNLTCVTVDDVIAKDTDSALTTRWNKDYDANFSDDCSAIIPPAKYNVFISSSKQLTIDSPSAGVANIYNLSGIPVVKSEINTGNQSLNLNNLKNSIYILNIVSEQGSFTKKLVLR